MDLTAHQRDLVERLRATLDARAGTYKALNGATDVADYLSRGAAAEDEETLTEPLLRELLQRLLGFPPDGYLEQLSRLGSKPDFTPVDLVAHRFVLDAKSTAQRDLDAHEPQIRRYVDQRRPALTLSANAEPFGRAEWDGSRLTFVYKRTRTGQVTGPPRLLTLLARLLHGRTGLRRDDVERLEVPGDPDAFSTLVEDRHATVQRLLDEGRRLVEEAERLVCGLYAVPPELEEAIVAHAAQRALETEKRAIERQAE